jgi:hypothetical protein
MEYAVTTQETVPRLAVGKSAAISAKATFTMERSNVEMYAALAVTTNVGQGLSPCFSVGVDTWLTISPFGTKNVPYSYELFAVEGNDDFSTAQLRHELPDCNLA